MPRCPGVSRMDPSIFFLDSCRLSSSRFPADPGSPLIFLIAGTRNIDPKPEIQIENIIQLKNSGILWRSDSRVTFSASHEACRSPDLVSYTWYPLQLPTFCEFELPERPVTGTGGDPATRFLKNRLAK